MEQMPIPRKIINVPGLATTRLDQSITTKETIAPTVDVNWVEVLGVTKGMTRIIAHMTLGEVKEITKEDQKKVYTLATQIGREVETKTSRKDGKIYMRRIK